MVTCTRSQCKFRNGERNLHCDIVYITTKWVSSLTLDCNGVFAIKTYDISPYLGSSGGLGNAGIPVPLNIHDPHAAYFIDLVMFDGGTS